MRQPASWRSRKPSGRRGRPGRTPPGRRGAGRRGRRPSRSPMRRPASGSSAIDGGSDAQITSPTRYSLTTKSAPTTSWSSQSTKARGARSYCCHSRDSTRYSRAMSWAPGSDRRRTAGGAARTRAIAEAQQVGQVGRAVGELQHAHRRDVRRQVELRRGGRRSRRPTAAPRRRAPGPARPARPGPTARSSSPLRAVRLARHRRQHRAGADAGRAVDVGEGHRGLARAPGGRRRRRAAAARSRAPGAARTRRSARRWRGSRRRC